ncbi:LysR family transcriptional regulator [Puniceibacterium sp. IMCC21224]|uniref:LysR family transcriptional regulator n=1 Tax=Puniceibacterium sp. IMCC21224 TaxID=1618204 RepID=UPI00064DBC94|nr:LysR family transcriptional regulator [Puniceibacterium sp. IMCC21224]
MDRFDAMRVFTRVAERRSFTLAANDLGLPRSTVTDAIKRLEERLGVRLLDRTTRVVRPTLDGEAYHRRCLAILADVDDAESAFFGATPKGMLRVDVHGTLARHFILPSLPGFLKTYPDIELVLSEGDRLTDLVREGIDCVLRVGVPQVSDMIARRVALLEEVTVASPAYLRRHGIPRHLDDLENGHWMIGFRSSVTGGALPLEFVTQRGLRNITLSTTLTVNAAESYIEAAKRGLGLIQLPRYHAAEALEAGELVLLLDEYRPEPSPVSLLYPRDRQLSPRVRVFMDWAAQTFASASSALADA